MERIILEVSTNGLNQYHTIKQFPVTIGRAYDNDIILSDRSISAHHIRIERSEYGNLMVFNLSNENGSVLNSKKLGKQAVEGGVPSLLLIGNLQLRLVSPAIKVETTHKHDCDNLFCLLGQTLWSPILLMVTMLLLFLERYLETPYARDTLYYFTLGFPYLVGILVATLFFSTISRLTVQRWHFLSIMSIISLLILLPQFLGHIGHALNYFFSSNVPSDIFDKISFLIVPLILIFFFTQKIYRTNIPLTIGISFTISFFYALPYILDSVDSLSIDTGFSDVPPYNQTLSYLDIRTENSINIHDFIQETRMKLDKEINDDIQK
jgi:hypothetical protein